jgi:PAB-dependent poly(A)-specific ribonuclease subunit 2
MPERQEHDSWHLFNDFLIRPIVKDEALTFNTAWKLPSVIAYQIKAANNHIDDSWKMNLDTSLLHMDTQYVYLSSNDANINNRSTNLGPKTYQPLDPTQEHPGPGTIIAIDTEFVSVRQPEIEINSDGDRETIRPTVYALARVSVIRGPSPTFLPTLEPGTPFIDDYISTTEPVVDYLTSYSGIVHGDLDPRTSRHNVVPLKIAYKKLWLLLNLGCTFLGHGLKQDFRVINIHVPRAQVIDTAENFFVAARLRKLSLAFLAWYLLKEDIQLETHDSIEDARAALKLYAKYLEFVDAGVLDTMLAEIYRRGRELGFKPPQRSHEVVTLQQSGEGATTGSSLSVQPKRAMAVPVSGTTSTAMSRSASAAPAAATTLPTTMSVAGPAAEPSPSKEGEDGSVSVSASTSPEKPDTLS